ncbi:MAG: hypothetical protein AW06_001155 [Candidatus Accumulibacter cognatus]|uniref:Uncharacterized protein n=1 Tax=Candidatus Accumulibacter cognatus TaxID=2954383 RepID=A0A080MB27_9PROT|nr:MAG: hypothetical protein AW06_001155 [Candidatus Accumulibacter cognatus]
MTDQTQRHEIDRINTQMDRFTLAFGDAGDLVSMLMD